LIKNIRILNKDPYYDMKKHALKTIGKVPNKNNSLDEEWIKKSIISRHSHIRCVFVEIEFETIKSIRDQILRSKHGFVEPFVLSQRPDRNNGEPRDSNALTTWIHVFNIEGLIKMCADRLCTSTEKETKAEIKNLKFKMMKHEDIFIRILGDMLSPKCCWYEGCNEFSPLNCYGMGDANLFIKDRIELYNHLID
jgi:hypothetical protein